MKLGIIESISVRHVARFLKEAELKPHAMCLRIGSLMTQRDKR